MQHSRTARSIVRPASSSIEMTFRPADLVREELLDRETALERAKAVGEGRSHRNGWMRL